LPAGPLREPVSRLKSVDFIVANGSALIGEFEMQFVIDENKKMFLQKLARDGERSICAIAGIGNPDRFFESLRSLNLQFQTKIFSDHYQFQKNDFNDVYADIILMTEKDAVKCRDFEDERFYIVTGFAKLDARLISALFNKLNF
jgi:tetraacyldisaccharide 4'-kinase